MDSSDSALGSTSFNDYSTNLQSTALKATRHAVSLATDLSFYRSMDEDLARDLDSFSARVLALTNRLLGLISTVETTQNYGKSRIKLEVQDDVVDHFASAVVDSTDKVLERTDICLDEFLGRRKPPAIDVNPVMRAPQQKANAPVGRLDPALQHASHLVKPQLSFRVKVDNLTTSPWYPNLKHKYNAQVPLGYHLHDGEGAETDKLSLHPYYYEITHTSYPSWMFESAPPIHPKAFDETSLSWVSTPAHFNVMLEKLRHVQEIAVDLEHHSYRSFSGFLCLMQISTREEDFIVDTLALREELEELNEVFTDPQILKVFHGAESDIIWLQQDFNLYIINLFDTYHASKVLELPKHGLATLLELYCDFIADKRYQLADWRIRPLPEEMKAYARSDTHFLLFIYDNLRNALIDRAQSQPRAQSPQNQGSLEGKENDNKTAHSLVREVLSRSERTSLRVYEREIYDEEEGSGPGGWDILAKKWNKGFLMAAARKNIPREIYRSIHAWRDRVAREEDESTRYVLPNHFLFQLAEKPPVDMAALLRVFPSIPLVVRRRSKELFDVIQAAAARITTGKGDLNDSEDVSEVMKSVNTEQPLVAGSCMEIELDNADSMLWSNSAWCHSAKSGPSLFGKVLSAKTLPEKKYLASGSSLFGASSGPSKPRIRDPRFDDLLVRIHSTLSIAPQVVTQDSGKEITEINIAASSHVATEIVEIEQSAQIQEQTEIPFVPSDKRQVAQSMEFIRDSIVVAGQARQRKRKRAHNSAAHEMPTPTPTQDADARLLPIPLSQTKKQKRGQMQSKKDDQESSEEIIAFDYSAAPNILDDLPPPEDKGRTKRESKRFNKGGKSEYGQFHAPPKAHREVKSGNQTQTFRQ